MPDTTFTMRVDELLKEQFAEAAKAQDRTSAQLMRDLMKKAVCDYQRRSDREAWFRCCVVAAEREAAEGGVVPGEVIDADTAEMEALLAQAGSVPGGIAPASEGAAR